MCIALCDTYHDVIKNVLEISGEVVMGGCAKSRGYALSALLIPIIFVE